MVLPVAVIGLSHKGLHGYNDKQEKQSGQEPNADLFQDHVDHDNDLYGTDEKIRQVKNTDLDTCRVRW